MDINKEITHGLRSTYCKHACRCSECAQANNDYYKANIGTIKTRVKEKRVFIQNYKIAMGCIDCGYNEDPVALDFDHLDPTTKNFTIGGGKDRSLKGIIEEIAKCDVVCAICHRIRTRDRREGRK